jgi:hypothetical protein
MVCEPPEVRAFFVDLNLLPGLAAAGPAFSEKEKRMKLDGTEKIAPVPFDAHEQVVRASHEHDPAEGYVPADYEHQDYPKAVAHDEKTGEPIVALNARHEAKLEKEAKADEAAD